MRLLLVLIVLFTSYVLHRLSHPIICTSTACFRLSLSCDCMADGSLQVPGNCRDSTTPQTADKQVCTLSKTCSRILFTKRLKAFNVCIVYWQRVNHRAGTGALQPARVWRSIPLMPWIVIQSINGQNLTGGLGGPKGRNLLVFKSHDLRYSCNNNRANGLVTNQGRQECRTATG